MCATWLSRFDVRDMLAWLVLISWFMTRFDACNTTFRHVAIRCDILRCVRHDLATHFDVCDTTSCITKLYHQVRKKKMYHLVVSHTSKCWLGDTTWWHTKWCHTHQNVSPSHVAHIATCAFLNVSKMWHFDVCGTTLWYILMCATCLRDTLQCVRHDTNSLVETVVRSRVQFVCVGGCACRWPHMSLWVYITL